MDTISRVAGGGFVLEKRPDISGDRTGYVSLKEFSEYLIEKFGEFGMEELLGKRIITYGNGGAYIGIDRANKRIVGRIKQRGDGKFEEELDILLANLSIKS